MSNAINNKPLLWLVAIGFFMQTLDSTIVNTALPAMAQSLGASPLKMQSVIISYVLTMAVMIPASGWVADRIGIRKAFFIAIVIFTIGSLLCGLSQSVNQLVLARIVQGVGGAMLLPVGRLAILKYLPREQFLPAMAFISIPGLVGPLIGPTLGGWIVESFSWHWIFLVNLPVGIIGALATLKIMPHFETITQRFDFMGYTLLVIGMVALSLALDGLSGLGFGQATVVVLMIIGLCALIAYWLHAAHSENPLFSLSLFKTRSFTIGIFGNLFARIGGGCMPFLLPLLLQISMGYTPMQAGLMMIPVTLGAMSVKRIVTKVICQFGYRKVLVGNTLLVGLGIASFALMSVDTPTWLRVIHMFLFGAINSIQFTAMNTLALKDLDSDHASSGNSLLSMVMMLSMSFGVAAASAILNGFEMVYAAEASLSAFKSTFVCMGLMTMAAAWVFWQLPKSEAAPTVIPPTQLVD